MIGDGADRNSCAAGCLDVWLDAQAWVCEARGARLTRLLEYQAAGRCSNVDMGEMEGGGSQVIRAYPTLKRNPLG